MTDEYKISSEWTHHIITMSMAAVDTVEMVNSSFHGPCYQHRGTACCSDKSDGRTASCVH